MDCYECPHSALNIDLNAGLYLNITINLYEGPTLPHYSLAYRTLFRHYNGQS
jgi:hypothetical protein